MFSQFMLRWPFNHCFKVRTKNVLFTVLRYGHTLCRIWLLQPKKLSTHKYPLNLDKIKNTKFEKKNCEHLNNLDLLVIGLFLPFWKHQLMLFPFLIPLGQPAPTRIGRYINSMKHVRDHKHFRVQNQFRKRML